jgi:hypothetical protein
VSDDETGRDARIAREMDRDWAADRGELHWCILEQASDPEAFARFRAEIEERNRAVFDFLWVFGDWIATVREQAEGPVNLWALIEELAALEPVEARAALRKSS